MPETIRYETSGAVLTITLDRPETLNALNRQCRAEMTAAWDAFEADDSLKVAVLTGEGRAFCSGADMKEAASEMNSGVMSPDDFRVEQGPMPLRVTKPVIGAVNGVAAGGALGMLSACDVLVASERASFVLTFAARGLMSSLALSLFSRKISPAWASWMALSNQPITVEQARDAGFVVEVIPHGQFPSRVKEMADAIATSDLATLRAIKEKLRAATFGTVNDALYAAGPMEEAFRAAQPGMDGVRSFANRGLAR